MKKLISCLFVVASFTTFATPINWEMSYLLAIRDLEIYATLEKTETDPIRKEALQMQIAKAKSRAESSTAAGRRAKDEEDALRRKHAFNAFGVSAVASVTGAVVRFFVGSRFPLAGPPVVTPAVVGLLATLGYTASEIIRRDRFEGVGTVFKAGMGGLLMGVMPVAIFNID